MHLFSQLTWFILQNDPPLQLTPLSKLQQEALEGTAVGATKRPGEQVEAGCR